MGSLISYKTNNGVAIVTIDNPPMNVMSTQVIKELEKTFQALEESPEVIVILLTSAGDRAFMAGADIKEFPHWLDLNAAELKENNKESHRVLSYIAGFSKPTIAYLNGYTFGGGCELALTCDLRVAAEEIQIGLPEVKLGLFPGGGGTQRLPRLIGEAKAKELMFTGEPIDAQEALRLGLVNKVVNADTGLRDTEEMARKIASYSLEALSRIKKSVNEGMQIPLEKGLEIESQYFVDIFNKQDAKEGVAAFLEKRQPTFIHK